MTDKVIETTQAKSMTFMDIANNNHPGDERYVLASDYERVVGKMEQLQGEVKRLIDDLNYTRKEKGRVRDLLHAGAQRALATELAHTQEIEKLTDRAAAAEARATTPVDMLLFCPACGEQHVDQAFPDVCETCGVMKRKCCCGEFTAWLNPPHKSHRCGFCNHVWRPADVPTNGVLEIKTKGERDGSAIPASLQSSESARQAAEERARHEARRDAFVEAKLIAEEYETSSYSDFVNKYGCGDISDAMHRLWFKEDEICNSLLPQESEVKGR